MTKVWVTADTHFRHENIITYCDRPFAYAKDMDEQLIKRWNSVVAPDDVVYHLGDFIFGKHNQEAQDIFDSLNGRKHLIVGNHDRDWVKKLGWVSYRNHFEILCGDSAIIMKHRPMLTWLFKNIGTVHIHGHTHGMSKPIRNRIDVGVDCHNFYPVLLSDLISEVKV